MMTKDQLDSLTVIPFRQFRSHTSGNLISAVYVIRFIVKMTHKKLHAWAGNHRALNYIYLIYFDSDEPFYYRDRGKKKHHQDMLASFNFSGIALLDREFPMMLVMFFSSLLQTNGLFQFVVPVPTLVPILAGRPSGV